MMENNKELGDKDKSNQRNMELTKDHENDKDRQPPVALKKESAQPGLSPTGHSAHTPQAHHNCQPSTDRSKRRSQFLDILSISRHHHHHHSAQHEEVGGHSGSSSSNASAQQSPLTPHAATNIQGRTDTISISTGSGNGHKCSTNSDVLMEKKCRQHQQHSPLDSQRHVQHHQQHHRASLYRTACMSFQSEIFLLDMTNGEMSDFMERSSHKDEFGTQRVYKKTSPNCVLTLYLPSREITLSGNSPSMLRGIVYVDPKAIHGYRVFSQLTLTFRYGREDEEVMGLRFCNEAIMSLHQIWPRNEELSREALSPLQEALLKRLGDGAHPFTLTLTAQAPPSVQLVPAKRYYGAPIGTSYDVRCFIADKTDEKFHRRASVKMGVRVIYRTDVFNHFVNGTEHFAALVNNPTASPPVTLACFQAHSTVTASMPSNCTSPSTKVTTTDTLTKGQDLSAPTAKGVSLSSTIATESRPTSAKSRKSERGDSFPKLRLSPKSFRISSRFGRSKSEAEKCPNDPFYNYSKSFQEYDSGATGIVGGGPQGAVDKPFLLQDGRVGLRASLNKAWYIHGEDVYVNVNIRNESRKTVRKVRVCAIQHVDVCMFNNGKFKNVVADSDNQSPPPMDRTVSPGGTLNTTITLKPQRGPTKNWIALEDTLQRSTEPEDVTGLIAASAVRTPHFLMQPNHSPNYCSSPAACIPPMHTSPTIMANPSTNEERNVFAIYVSYYVKVKLTLSGMGGELSLKLPFMLVHIDEDQRHMAEIQVDKLALDDVPANKKTCNKTRTPTKVEPCQEFSVSHSLDRIESVEDENIQLKVSHTNSLAVAEGTLILKEGGDAQQLSATPRNGRKRQLLRSETIAKDLDDDQPIHGESQTENNEIREQVHVVQIHSSDRLLCDEQHHQKDQNKPDHRNVSARVTQELNTNQIQPSYVSESHTSSKDVSSNALIGESKDSSNV